MSFFYCRVLCVRLITNFTKEIDGSRSVLLFLATTVTNGVDIQKRTEGASPLGHSVVTNDIIDSARVTEF